MRIRSESYFRAQLQSQSTITDSQSAITDFNQVIVEIANGALYEE